MAVAADMMPHERRKVLMSAYACGPGDEPEGAAGWAFAVAAAQEHDVWVLTRRRFEPAVSAALRDDPSLARHLRVEYLDLSKIALTLKNGPAGLYLYYSLWQRELGRRAKLLHQTVDFDVMHHVTFANDWLPCGLLAVPDVPLVWGPVGGASRPPWRLGMWMGVRGLVTEIVRTAVVWPIRRRFGDAAAGRASLVVAQNADVARRFRGAARVVVQPNAAMEAASLVEAVRVSPVEQEGAHAAPVQQRSTPGPRAVMVGRLIGLKACRLALAALAHPAAEGWRLDIFGDGYDRAALVRRVESLGLSERVTFHGHRPRKEVLRAIAAADGLLFPSFRDQAGWVAAEASSFGVPVVCLPLGGPALLAGSNARVVSLDGDVVENLALALAECAENPGRPDDRWSARRMPDLVRGWYATAAADRIAFDGAGR